MEIKVDERLKGLLEPLQGEELDVLVEDIAERGIQNPIIVDQNGYIIDGHTRYQIAQILGIENIPVKQIEVSDEDERLERALALNLQRRKQVPTKRLKELALELHSRGWDVDRIARALSVRKETVKHWINPVPPKDEPPEVKGLMQYWAIGFLVKIQGWLVGAENSFVLIDRRSDMVVVWFTRGERSFEIEVRQVGRDEYVVQEWLVNSEGIREMKVAEFTGTMNKSIAFMLSRLNLPFIDLDEITQASSVAG
jgi:ParB-like chromosome segregation protein Spo0J